MSVDEVNRIFFETLLDGCAFLDGSSYNFKVIRVYAVPVKVSGK